MRRSPILIICLALIVTIQVAWAGDVKDSGGDMATADLCSSCSYTLADATVMWSSVGAGFTESYHNFSAFSNGMIVTQLTASFRVHNNGYGMAWAHATSLRPGVIVETSYNDFEGANYIQVTVEGLSGALVTNEPIFSLHIQTQDCRSQSSGMEIEVVSCEGLGYLNEFQDDDPQTASLVPGIRNSGYRYYQAPVADLTLLGPGMESGATAGTAYIGGTASIQIYFNELNFHYKDSGYIFLQFDPELEFVSIATNGYSIGMGATDATESSVKIHTGDYTGWDNNAPLPISEIPVSMMTVTFRAQSSSAVPGESYAVSIGAPAEFFACGSYGTTGDNSAEYVNIAVLPDAATWKFGTTSVNKNTSVQYPVLMRPNVPIATDDPDVERARFAFDKNQFTYATYTFSNVSYYLAGVGTFHWSAQYLESYPDPLHTVLMKHDVDYDNPTIPASFDFMPVAAITLLAGGTIGTYHPAFADVPTGNFAYWRDANSQYHNFTVANGKLSLIGGSLTITSPPPPPPTSCPMLYAWNGSEFVLEDVLLTSTQGKIGQVAADDYYPLKILPPQQNGFYQLQLRENEQEITFLDAVNLLVVDYPQDHMVAISNEGEVIAYQQEISPLAASDAAGNDILSLVSTRDEVWMDAEGAGFMTLTYPNPCYNNPGARDGGTTLALGNGQPPICRVGAEPEPKADPNNPRSKPAEALIAEVRDINGVWHNLGAINAREQSFETNKWLFDTDQIELGETFDVRITWENGYRVDLEALYIGQTSNFVVHTLAPTSAIHSVIGKVNTMVDVAESDALTLIPGQMVDLAFEAPDAPVSPDYDRKLFLWSRGYYRALQPSDLLPNEYRLLDNYPNPFNPTTTISFTVPHASRVSLVVYNTLGQEVKTLLDQEMNAGTHDVQWSGDNNQGASVASGVYFYRLTAGDFTNSKKMILVK